MIASDFFQNKESRFRFLLKMGDFCDYEDDHGQLHALSTDLEPENEHQEV